MKIARVVAHVVSTQKVIKYHGMKTLLVKPLRLDGSEEGSTFVAIDRVQAGIGDMVLLMQEGSSARTMFFDEQMPARSVIVGIIDHLEINE